MSIAHELNNKQLEDVHFKDASWSYEKNEWTFSDGSKGRVITIFEDCMPYMTPSLSTLAKKAKHIWKEL